MILSIDPRSKNRKQNKKIVHNDTGIIPQGVILTMDNVSSADIFDHLIIDTSLLSSSHQLSSNKPALKIPVARKSSKRKATSILPPTNITNNDESLMVLFSSYTNNTPSEPTCSNQVVLPSKMNLSQEILYAAAELQYYTHNPPPNPKFRQWRIQYVVTGVHVIYIT